jgi:hypothetical protein
VLGNQHTIHTGKPARNTKVWKRCCYRYSLDSAIWIFLAIWGFELRTLHLLGKHYTTWAVLPALFFLLRLFFDTVLCLLYQLVSNHNPPSYASCSSWVHRCIPPYSAYLLRWDHNNILSGWSWTTILLISTCGVTKIMYMSYCSWPWIFAFSKSFSKFVFCTTIDK